jgi:RNase P/RNase MRP subunit p29
MRRNVDTTGKRVDETVGTVRVNGDKVRVVRLPKDGRLLTFNASEGRVATDAERTVALQRLGL